MAESKKARWHKHANATVAFIWAAILPLSFIFGWAYSVAFVSFCSIYANAATHWAAREGAADE